MRHGRQVLNLETCNVRNGPKVGNPTSRLALILLPGKPRFTPTFEEFDYRLFLMVTWMPTFVCNRGVQTRGNRRTIINEARRALCRWLEARPTSVQLDR